MKLFRPRGPAVIVPRDQHFPGRAAIEAFGNGGFRFADMSHRGSVLCLPSGIHGWAPATPAEITVASLEKALADAAAFELLLVGSGPSIAPLAPDVRAALKEAGLRADVMSTGSAVRTYHILIGENRKVAAALLAVD